MRQLKYAVPDPDGLVGDEKLPQPQVSSFGLPGFFPFSWPYLDLSVGTVTAGRLNLVRFTPSRDFTMASAAFVLTATVGVSGDAVEVAIYNADLSQRLATSGQVTGKLSTAEVNTVPLSYTFQAGQVYYVGIIVPATSTAQFVQVQATGGQVAVNDIAGTAYRPSIFNAVGNAVAPASLAGGVAGQNRANTVPLLFLREA